MAWIALLLTQLVMIRKQVITMKDRLYQALGIAALLAQLLWQITPGALGGKREFLLFHLESVAGWSVIRLIERLSQEKKVTSGLLMGAAAGYLLLGLTAGL